MFSFGFLDFLHESWLQLVTALARSRSIFLLQNSAPRQACLMTKLFCVRLLHYTVKKSWFVFIQTLRLDCLSCDSASCTPINLGTLFTVQLRSEYAIGSLVTIVHISAMAQLCFVGNCVIGCPCHWNLEHKLPTITTQAVHSCNLFSGDWKLVLALKVTSLN